MEQEKVTCAFCHDRYCIKFGSGRRINFAGIIKPVELSITINDCPKYRKAIDFVSGKSDNMPSDNDPIE